jgi:hypothetical protein
MASVKHDGLVALFRNRPTLAAELLQGPLGVALPTWSEARVESSDFTQVVTTEYRADLVILLFEGKPVFAIVVEVQLSRDDEKRTSWPVYLSSLRARLRCPTVLLVVAPNRAVARWCAKPIELGNPGFVLQPLVAGPSAIPLILGKQAAGREPELAVLSALAHGHDSKLAPALFEAVVSSAQRLDKERLSFYIDLAVSAFGGAARSALEAFMQSGGYQYQSELVRKLVGHGLKQGLRQGEQKGRLEGEHRALLKVLKARRLAVDDTARRRILACTQLAQLELWLGKAVTVQSVQELFKHKLTARRSARTTVSGGRNLKVLKPRARR